MEKKYKIDFTVRILIAVVVVFALTNFGILFYVRQNSVQNASASANHEIDQLLLYVEEELGAVEISALNLPNQLDLGHVTDVERSYAAMERYLNTNKELTGVVIALDPARLSAAENADGKGFCILLTRTDSGLVRVPVHEYYDYLASDWYKTGITAPEGAWATAMRNTIGQIISPYAMQLRNERGEVLGVICADISLERISRRMDSIKPFRTSTVSLMGKDGRFLAHPDKSLVMSTPIDSVIMLHKLDINETIYHDIKNVQRGENSYHAIDGTQKMLYYCPMAKTGWTIFVDCDRDEIYQASSRLKWSMLISFLINILFFGGVCWRIIRLNDNLEAETLQQAKMENELATASRIQMSMVPKIFPPFPDRKDMDIFATIKPAKAVGGDLYDFFIKGDELFTCIGDVSGKGVPASLFMAITRTLFRVISNQTDDPAEIFTRMNDTIAPHNEENMFVTMQLARLNLRTGALVYSNAGHNAPVVLKKSIEQPDGLTKTWFRQVKPGLPIGCFAGFKYEDEYAQLIPGDGIFIYTDGITEAENADHELYGDDRLIRTLSQQPANATVNEVVEGVIASVQAHTNGADQSDDITALCMIWVGDRAPSSLDQ